MGDEILRITIKKSATILYALKQMDSVGVKLLIVVQDNKYLGLLSIGDIQRSIINNIDLNSSIETIMRNDYVVSKPQEDINDVKEIMLKIRSEFMPIVDEENNILGVYFWKDLFQEKPNFQKINLPVVIMAGGKGTRLKPLTNVLPKPLIPLGDKTILEEIMDRFVAYECKNFFLSVNYKADFIKYYLESLKNETYNVEYFQETKPLGTAGSLSLLKGKVNTSFFVSNCDIIIDQDYSEIYKYHRDNQNEITIVVALKHIYLPYGTVQSGDNGQLKSIKEKPELTFKVNSGMYILEPHLLEDIPEDSFFHITELIEKVKKRKGKIGVFPVSEKSWTDIGQWNEYNKIISNYTS